MYKQDLTLNSPHKLTNQLEYTEGNPCREVRILPKICLEHDT